jgi:hypothetical protein
MSSRGKLEHEGFVQEDEAIAVIFNDEGNISISSETKTHTTLR